MQNTALLLKKFFWDLDTHSKSKESKDSIISKKATVSKPPLLLSKIFFIFQTIIAFMNTLQSRHMYAFGD